MNRLAAPILERTSISDSEVFSGLSTGVFCYMNLHKQHTASPPVQTSTGSSCDADIPTVQGTRPYNKQEEISSVTSAISGVLGLPSVLNYTEVLDPQRETSKDTPGCIPSPEADYRTSDRTGKVCGEDSVTRGVTVSPSPLRGDSKV